MDKYTMQETGGQPHDGPASTPGVNKVTPAPVPDAERFVDAFDALFPQDRLRFFEWAEDSWYGTLGRLRYEFKMSPDGFCIPVAELIGGLLRAGYRLDPRDTLGREIGDPHRALYDGQWSSGPWGA